MRISKNFNSIRKILVEIGVVILYFYMLLPVANSATPISSCTDINSPGEYYLERSLISTTAYCISIWANNVILDCRGYKIDGFGAPKVYGKNYGIYVTRNNIQTTNITIKNCVVTNWVNGIYLSKSSGNTITGSTISSNSNGIYLYESSGNTITGSTISSNSNGIFHHAGSLSNLVYYNRIEKNEVGIQIGPYAGRDWLIYNNLFNNSANVYVSQQNNWNTIQQSGTRIYSQGREIGGNYWTNYTNNGYSDICNDANCDGFCDQPFILNDLNIDYLPLSNKYDADPPTYYNPSYSTPYAGYPVNFSILLKDNCAGLFHYEFWFDNCTGNLIKVAEEDYWWGYVPQKWVNLTLEINSTVGCMIRWCLKFVDKNGNLYDNCGWPFYFYTRLPPFYSEADLISPPPQFEIIQGRTFLVNASVTCKGYRAQCLNVSATVRYNRTTSLPNFPINETEGAKPLHVVKTKVWPYNYTCISNCMKNPYEDELDDDSDFLLEVYEYNGQRGIAEFKYYGISPNSTLYILTSIEEIYGTPYNGYIQIFNFSSNSWYNWLYNIPKGYYNISITPSSGLVQNGRLILRLYPEFNSIIEIYNTYIEQSSNRLMCGDLKENESCNLIFGINATENYFTSWSVDVLFNMSGGQNDTSNSIVKIIPGVMSVDLTSPYGGNFNQYSIITAKGRVYCDGNCGQIFGVLKYNRTSQFPDTEISNIPATPFYIISNYSVCQGSYPCLINWTLNVTGEKYTDWKIGITISSDLLVGKKTSNNVTISIIPRNCSQKPFLINSKLRLTVECEGQFYSFARSKEEFNFQYPWKVEFDLYQISSTPKNFMAGFGNGGLDSYGRPANSFVFEFNDTHIRFLRYNSSLIEELGSITYSKPFNNHLSIEVNSSNITFIVDGERLEFPFSSSVNSWYFFVNAYNSKDTIVDLDNIIIRKNILPEPQVYIDFNKEEYFEVKRLGLASEQRKQNLISLEKVSRLYQICSQGGYESLKTNFGLDAEFYLVIKKLDDRSVLLACGSPLRGEPFALIERIIALDDGSYAKLELRVWK